MLIQLAVRMRCNTCHKAFHGMPHCTTLRTKSPSSEGHLRRASTQPILALEPQRELPLPPSCSAPKTALGCGTCDALPVTFDSALSSSQVTICPTRNLQCTNGTSIQHVKGVKGNSKLG